MSTAGWDGRTHSARLETATLGSEDRCSIQLSYECGARPVGPAHCRRDGGTVPSAAKPDKGGGPMADPLRVRFTVNGKPAEASTPAERTLLEVLREDLHLTGTK